MSGAPRGRPPNPLDPDASHAARLGAEIRTYRLERGLTLQALGDLTGYTPQYISEVERAKTPPAQPFVAACDCALEAHGALLALLPAAMRERDREREERAAARRAARDLASLRCEAHSDAGENVDPTNRRGVIGAAGAAGLALSTVAAPAAAREIDPELPMHLSDLLRVLGRHDDIFGPRDLIDTVTRELRMIAEYRDHARGELRIALMRIEARWSDLAAWLNEDTGAYRARDTWAARALRLAQESDYADMVAFARGRQSSRARSAQRAIAFAEHALRASGASAQTRAWCSRQAALGYALAGDASACERRLADAYGLLDDESPPPPWAGGYRVAHAGTLADEARCWAELDPAKAIGLYDDALRDWPRAEVRDGGLQRARLALACAAAGERDRAEAEGRMALAIARSTGSTAIGADLKRLGQVLSAN
jgi:transcriptional regulator with XRE-family HTH domain